MTLLRTPDERFQDLPQWPWAPRYLDDLPGFEGIRVHRVDEPGRPGAPTALLLHGNPTWSYLYRTMIPVFLDAGLRVVAPDLIGFGRSDKPADASFHRFATHRHFLMSLIERLDLSNVMLPLGEVSEGFLQWRNYCNSTPDMAVGRLLARGRPELTAAEQAAYDAPFPDARHKAALAAFANMVPDSPEADGADIGRRAARPEGRVVGPEPAGHRPTRPGAGRAGDAAPGCDHPGLPRAPADPRGRALRAGVG
jgi:pimeloyl-ACP methyl ester carboxylesterase